MDYRDPVGGEHDQRWGSISQSREPFAWWDRDYRPCAVGEWTSEAAGQSDTAKGHC